MTSFWVVAGIFIVAALLFVLPTLLRSRQDKNEIIEREAANIAIYRDQLVELDNDLRNDILSQEQYEKSKQELHKRMLQDLETASSQNSSSSSITKSRGIASAAIVILAIPLAAISLYMILGDTRGLLPQSQLASATQFHSEDMTGPPGHAEMKSVVDNLIARLNENPEDVEGWLMLGRTFAILGQFDQASATYAKLIELIPDSAPLLSDYADMLAMTNDGSLKGKPTELIYRALEIDPDYPKALALAGTAEFEEENYDQAAVYWERLLTVIPPESQLAKSVGDSIAEAKSLAMKGDKEIAPMQLAQNSNISTDMPAETKQQRVSEKKAEAKSNTISGTVTLSPSFANKVSPSDTLFVYARAKTGPKMPLAILRLSAKDLPATFTLNDDMAMMPNMKMSSFPEVVINARISRTGQAMPGSGDLEGYSQPVEIGDSDVTVVIDQIIP